MKHFTALLLLALLSNTIYSQGLENIILEYYYVSDANDATDTDGGFLTEGSVTYRIYVDMAPGYELQAVYGNDDHELRIETSTYFFNNVDRGETIGSLIPHNRIDENTVALDSWIAMNGATTLRLGVPKTADVDGSLVGGANNDGGSEGIAGGLLVNNDPLAGIALTTSDGLRLGTVPSITVVGLDVSMLDNVNDGPVFTSNGGAWSVLEGVQGPTSDNIVLIAQITTDGDLSYSLNLQLGAPGGGTEQYVASNPIGNEQFFEGLAFPIIDTGEGCTSTSACNYDPTATVDNGTCIEPTANCQICNTNNDGLVIVDLDGDGICNALEVQGCTLASACNYNSLATDDDGSCIIPEANCTICNALNDGLVLVDTDNDGVCDAEENPGCNNPVACNYDPLATGDDGSCVIPTPNCTICNSNNDGLLLVDEDNDGTCNLEEIGGCTNEFACNYDPAATEEDDSCILPTENCLICNENNNGLVLVDADGDGICNAQEINGCTSPTACNYNSEATDDDGTCIEPIENCFVCNENNDGLVIVDSDNDGTCDAQENLGCTSETACNFDPEASNDDGSCIEPVDDCFECNENNNGLIIIDSDGDGICNAEEIAGCTDPLADNYNPDATDDDGSCEYSSGGGCNPEMGLEDVLVEIYYLSDENDSNDEDGGSDLALGSVTYRIYADLTPGYELQAVFGNSDHELRIETSTFFYNNADRGEETGDAIDNTRIDENTVALDSWLTMGPATDAHMGIVKTEDTDGSIVGGENNDGGSEGISEGLLINDNAVAGIPLTESDGLVASAVPSVTVVGLDISMFGNENGGPLFSSNSGAWSVLEGVQGTTENNRVLIAQLTTDGTLCFDLNLQLGNPEGGTVQFVAANAIGDQIQCDALSFCSAFGCTNPIACNYDPSATFDNGSCLIPEENCYECNADNTALVIIDSDGDGICDAYDFIPDNNGNQKIDIYPNPSSDIANIVIETTETDVFRLVVTNSIGETVYTENIGVVSGQKRFGIDVSNFADGIYQVTVSSASGTVNKTLLKTR